MKTNKKYYELEERLKQTVKMLTTTFETNENLEEIIKKQKEEILNLKEQISDKDIYAKMLEQDIRDYQNLHAFTKIIQDKKTTVVWFRDGKKVVVRLAKGDKGSVYCAVAYAIVKNIFGTNSAYKKYVDKKKRLTETN